MIETVPTRAGEAVRVDESWGVGTKRDFAVTAATTAVIAVSSVAAYWIIGTLGSDETFARYALGRRIIAAGVPLMLLGLGTAVPRSVAILSAGQRDDAQAALSGALISVLVLAALGVTATGLFRDRLAELLYADGSAQYLVVVTSMLAATLALQGVCYGYLRGRMRFLAANVYALCVFVVAQLGSIFVGRGDVAAVFGLYAAGTLAVTIVAIGSDTKWLMFRAGFTARSWTAASGLLRYGIPRVPGDAAFGFLMAAPSVAAGHLIGLEAAGALAFGTTLITMVGTAASPVSMMLLPHAARSLNARGIVRLRKLVTPLMRWGMYACVCVSVAGALVAPQLLKFFAGENFGGWALAVAIVSAGAGPFLYHVFLRSVVDAAYTRPLNAYATYVAMAGGTVVAFGTSFTLTPVVAIAVGHVAGMILLACASRVLVGAALAKGTLS